MTARVVAARLLPMSVVAAALLAMSGVAALGQAGNVDDQQAVSVTGTSTLVGQISAGVTRVAEGIVQVRDNVLVTVEESTDPRAAGRATITLNIDVYPAGASPAQIRYGSMRIENAAGAWEGHFTGRLTERGFTQTYWLTGEGAYAGLSYVVTAAGSGPVWRSQGLIYPGKLPPLRGGVALGLDGPGIELPTA